MTKNILQLVELLRKLPIEQWVETTRNFGEAGGLTQSERTRAMMLADGRTEDEIVILIKQIQDEKEIDQMLKIATDLATQGNPEELRHNIHRLAQLTIKIRQGMSYQQAFREIYPEQ